MKTFHINGIIHSEAHQFDLFDFVMKQLVDHGVDVEDLIVEEV